MENRAYALVTGVFLIGVIAAIVVAAQWLGGERRERLPYRVVATQPVSGLNVQALVRYRGIAVGRVTGIGLDPKNRRRILIDTEIDTDVPVTRSTYAQLGMEGITGVAYVHLLDDGSSDAPPAKGADGVPEIAARPSFMDTLSDNAEGISKDAREMITNLNQLLNPENRQRIGRTLASLERVATNLDTASQKLPSAVARFDALLGDDNRKLVHQSLEHLNQTAAALPELAREAQRLAQDSRALVAQINKLSQDAQGTTVSFRDGTLPQVNALAESVERSATRFGRLSYELSSQPDSVLWGRRAGAPGPGEPGFK